MKDTVSAEFMSRSDDETRALGRRTAELLPPGAVVALIGDLGAGKTRWVQGMGDALGVAEESIVSPTFVLIHEYPGRMPLYHFDVYRITPAEFADLGPDEYFEGDGLCVVEWADRVSQYLPPDRIEVRFEIIDPSTRRITVTGHGNAAEWLSPLLGDATTQDRKTGPS
ncbi:MAG: tRNA (adenosine(37)-N6)-threonylcarbamoyltransferase complex ATPase subunit type 1 TsaE [Planctomycetota bacterium]|nr:MAG: tRNA (adenosine(37)-N6)-threonylcarbamoyltransferase complex ATPase subunit type 1 TsaE [Planctomycetota bacterium]